MEELAYQIQSVEARCAELWLENMKKREREQQVDRAVRTTIVQGSAKTSSKHVAGALHQMLTQRRVFWHNMAHFQRVWREQHAA